MEQVIINVLREEGKIAAVKKHRELYKLSLNETVQIINKMNDELLAKK
jgi:ribosomal protein L7/L12